MNLIVCDYSESMHKRRGCDQDIGIPNQISTMIQVCINLRSVRNNLIGEQQYAVCCTEEVKSGQLGCGTSCS